MPAEALIEGDAPAIGVANSTLPQNGTSTESAEGAHESEDALPPPSEGQRRAAFNFETKEG